MNPPDFAGRHFYETVTAFAVIQRRLLTGAARDLATTSGCQLDVMNVGAERNGRQGKRISQIWCRLIAGHHPRANAQTVRCQNITKFAIAVLDKSDAGRAVGIVLDSQDFRLHPAFAPFEIDLAIMLFVTAADVARSQPPEMITTAGLFLRLEQTLRRSRFRNFIESWERLESQRRSKWAKRL